ncbi:MAG: cyanophycinase [Maribacter sp.]|nr:cyanophycinase [Maribacter sp.]
MKVLKFIIVLSLLIPKGIYSQSFTSYRSGNPNDLNTIPDGGICLMGGSSENDRAMKWFLQKANGGDVLVLRTSGSDGYNDYMFSELGIPLNSVETIVFHNRAASYDATIQQKVQQAEAIWLAGGDQWTYVSYWRNTPIDSLINAGIKNRNVVIGGTSAGMAVMGSYYFSAKYDTVTSEEALENPYDKRVTVDSAKFITNEILSNVITDTHYANRNRKGRQVTFLARILVDYGVKAKGIACDEQVAVCIDTKGRATVFGNHPKTENKAYFIQMNNEVGAIAPENCTPNTPLTWKSDGKPLQVYAAYGTMDGKNTFDLTDWKTGKGGAWENWHVESGRLIIQNKD